MTTPATARTPAAFASVNGVNLCYDTFGDRADPPLVLIMGLGAQMTAWDDQFCASLASRGRFVVRFDNRDIGLSTKLEAAGIPNIQAMVMSAMQGKPVTSAYTLADMANDTIGLIDLLGLAPAHVVGASMGGMIAQQIAADHPEKVRTLTSIMSTTGDPSLPPAKPEAMAVLFTPPPTELAPYLVNYNKVWTVLRGPDCPPDEAGDIVRGTAAFNRGLSPAGTARQMAAIIAAGNRRAKVSTIKVPTLVIHGESDPLVTIEGGVDTAKAINGAKLVRVPGMGHALPPSVWPVVVDAIIAHTA